MEKNRKKKKQRGIGPGSCHDPGLMRLRPLAPASGHMDHHWFRFVSKPGLMVISPEAVVLVRGPGQMAQPNRD